MDTNKLHEILVTFYNEITADLFVDEETKSALKVAGKALNESGYFHNSLTLLASEAVNDYQPRMDEVKEDLEWYLTFACA